MHSSVRRILKRGGGGARKFRKFENNKYLNENFSTQNQSGFPVQNQMKTKKKEKRSSLKLSPVFGPKLDAGQKQRFSPTVCVFKPSAQVTKGGEGHAAILHTILG